MEYTRQTAFISKCGRYRWALTREWHPQPRGPGKPAPSFDRVMFIGLNPSTADAREDDPTIRRCVGFARSWGYSRLIMTNLFALRSTDPKGLLLHPDPEGEPYNDRHLTLAADNAELIVAAWGAVRVPLLARAVRVTQLILGLGYPLHALRVTQEGQPGHPLYLPGSLTPVKWKEPETAG